MAKKESEPKQAPTVETTPQAIVAETPPPASIIVPVEVAKPITTSELVTDMPAATITPEATPQVSASALIDDSQPMPAATTCDILTSFQPSEQSEQPYRSRVDWTKVDWTERNADLARENGVTPQYVSQLRKKHDAGTLKAPKAGESPDFSDVSLTPQQAAVDYAVLASTTFDLSVGILTMIFGPEWQPKAPEEKQAVVMPLKAYMASKQMKDLPPGVILCVVCIAYAAPRFQAPTTSTKVKLAWTWTKDKFNRFLKRRKATITVLPQPEKKADVTLS